MADGLEVRKSRDGELTTIVLVGVIDEAASEVLTSAFADVRGLVRINFRGIRRINSYGIGLLMKHLSQIVRDHRVEFVECSETIVDQFQMLDFSVYGRITSFVIRYFCPSCSAEEGRLLSISDVSLGPDGALSAPEYKCGCGGALRVDDSLEFLADHL